MKKTNKKKPILVSMDVQFLYPNIYIGVQTWKFSKFRETIHRYRVCTPCRNDETNFCFPQQILAETVCKQW